MQRCLRFSVFACMLLALAGCNTLAGQPHITSAGVEPPAIPLGGSAVISVELKDKHHSVAKIEGAVKEDPRLKFRLKDDGKDPDKKAGDGVWTLKVDVPAQAPPGQFTVDLTAYNSSGVPVLVRPKGESARPLGQSLPITIDTAQLK